MEIINPATEKVIAHLKEDDLESIELKFLSSKAAQENWRNRDLTERIGTLGKLENLLGGFEDELARLLTSEMGKPLAQSRAELSGARGRIEFFVQNSSKWLSEEVITDGDVVEKITYEPLGVIGNISAWNYPYLVGVNVFVPALIAGNCVMYKPSEFTSLTGRRIKELLVQAGVPDDVFQVVIGGGEAGRILVETPLDGYFFTGSYPTGVSIYRAVSDRMVPCQMELGGKDPLYVSNDVQDVARAGAMAVEGAFYNNGQSCCAVERIYVHKDVYSKFLEEFLKELDRYRLGDPLDSDTRIGPVSRSSHLDFLDEQVKDAVNKGGQVLRGGNKSDRPGYYYEPTVIVAVDHSMAIMKEESFGPVIGIQKVDNAREALMLMEDTEFGLTAAVFSDHYETAREILEKLNTGTVYWNCSDRVSANLPWSGRKKSGIGSTLSYQGIRAFVQPKSHHLRSLK